MAKPSEEIITIEVLNWEKHQYHHGKKTVDWFKIKNNMMDDAEVASLTDFQFRIWIKILTLCSRYQSRTVKVTRTYLRGNPNVPVTYVERALTRFEELQWVTRFSGALYRIERLERKKIHTINPKSSQPSVANSDFNFLEIYSKYPRKIGKNSGLRICNRSIKTQKDFDSLSIAVANYSLYCQQQALDLRYIKHFSTFMNNWRDWIDPVSETKKYISILDILGEQEREI